MTADPPPRGDRRSLRRAETTAAIVDAAWELAGEKGLAGLSMRDLGGRVGMRAQSVYSYFGSKEEIYDAMFRKGYEQLLEWMQPVLDSDSIADPADDDPVELLRAAAHRFFEFCTGDPVRYQLLFQRTVPGFEPSVESYAVAVRTLELSSDAMRRAGITDPSASDLWTAVLTGLTDQQISNDPGGDRWQQLIDRSVTMLVAELAPHLLDLSSTSTHPNKELS